MSSREIPLAAPSLRGNEAKYVAEALASGWISPAGPFVARLERQVAERVGIEHAVATQSGTAALHLALRALGAGPGDEVLVSTLSFVAPANAVRYVGATPLFVDAEPDHGQMDAARVVRFLDEECERRGDALVNRASGRPVRGIVAVHVLGHAVDLDPILEAARGRGLFVIEDACEGLGAVYRGRPVGSLGDIACFSFNANKVVTAAGGGMLVTRSGEHAGRARYWAAQAKDDPVEYRHEEVGFNYGLSNVQAAIGCAQLERLDEHLAAKRAIAARYADAFRGTPVRLLGPPDGVESAWWLPTALVGDRRAVGAALDGVVTRPLWRPLHLLGAHAGSGVLGGEVAENLHETALSLPCSVELSDQDQKKVIGGILAALRSPAGETSS